MKKTLLFHAWGGNTFIIFSSCIKLRWGYENRVPFLAWGFFNINNHLLSVLCVCLLSLMKKKDERELNKKKIIFFGFFHFFLICFLYRHKLGFGWDTLRMTGTMCVAAVKK